MARAPGGLAVFPLGNFDRRELLDALRNEASKQHIRVMDLTGSEVLRHATLADCTELFEEICTAVESSNCPYLNLTNCWLGDGLGDDHIVCYHPTVPYPSPFIFGFYVS